MKPILKILSQAKSLWPYYTAISVFSILLSVSNLLWPLLSGWLIDEIRLGVEADMGLVRGEVHHLGHVVLRADGRHESTVGDVADDERAAQDATADVGLPELLPVGLAVCVQGSVEAIMGALKKLGTDEVEARIVHSGVGGITESDIALASASKSATSPPAA